MLTKSTWRRRAARHVWGESCLSFQLKVSKNANSLNKKLAAVSRFLELCPLLFQSDRKIQQFNPKRSEQKCFKTENLYNFPYSNYPQNHNKMFVEWFSVFFLCFLFFCPVIWHVYFTWTDLRQALSLLPNSHQGFVRKCRENSSRKSAKTMLETWNIQ